MRIYAGLFLISRSTIKFFKKSCRESSKRIAVDHVVGELGVSVRRACRVVGQLGSTQRRVPTPRVDEAALTNAIISLAERFGRHGYRRITALLNDDIWSVSEGRVYRI